MVKILANKRRIEVDIIANDKASSAFNSVRNASSSMASVLMTALGGSANLISGFDNTLRSYNSSMYRFNRIATSVFKAAGESVYNFTKDAINNFTELERQHAKTMGAMATNYGTTTEAQAKFLEDSEKLKQQAKTLGTYGPTGNGSLYTINDVSYAQTALVKSGMSADNILNTDALTSILKFAGGNDLDVDTATTFAVNLATVFDKPVEEWGSMLDMITKAADLSVIDVEDIMNSLTYTGGIASGLGRDLEEVLGVISVMGQAGLRGRVAGTGLQAFFTRILSAGELSDIEAGNAPTKHAAGLYDKFVLNATTESGSFKSMDEVAAALDEVMGEMNDQEQAWFAKKLFGLYQMKAAYALAGSVDEETNLITDYINQISNESKGANDIKYNLMLGSQYGKLESLKNVWEGIKTDVGDDLSPIVSTISDELFAFLKDPQNYDINWDNLRDAISESGALIGEKYGEELGKAIEDLGNLGIDAGLIGSALMPEVGGIASGILKLATGDISGALDDFKNGLDDTNTEIDDLPPELQKTAEAARNVIGAFAVLSGINLATNIAQIFTSALNMFIAKPINAIKSIINASKTDVTSASTTTNSTSANVKIGTATSVNISKVPLMNVTASVVNVYGKSTGNPTNPTNPTTPTTPTLPTIPTVPVLPSGSTLKLPGSSTLQLPSGNPAPSVVGDPSKATNLYKVFGKYMTGGQIVQAAKPILATTAKLAGLAGTLALLSTVPSAESQPAIAYQQGFGTDYENYLGENYKNINSISELLHEVFRNGGTWTDDGSNYKTKQFMKNEVDPATPDEYRQARDELFNAIEGFKDYETGKQYIAGVMDRWYYENSDGNKYFISQDQYLQLAASLVEAMGQYMSDNEVEDTSVYANAVPGSNTDIYKSVLDEFVTAVKEIAKENKSDKTVTDDRTGIASIGGRVVGSFAADNGINLQGVIDASKGVVDASQGVVGASQGIMEKSQGVMDASQGVVKSSQEVMSTSQGIIEASQSVINNTQSVIDSVNSAMNRIKQPIINVRVTTNVDKNGNASSIVAKDFAEQSSRYGVGSFQLPY